MARMLDLRLRDLTRAGWVLGLLSIGISVLLCIEIGGWVLEEMDRGFLRAWSRLLSIVLAVPAVLVAVLAFLAGRKLLQRVGVPVARAAPSKTEEQ